MLQVLHNKSVEKLHLVSLVSINLNHVLIRYVLFEHLQGETDQCNVKYTQEENTLKR